MKALTKNTFNEALKKCHEVDNYKVLIVTDRVKEHDMIFKYWFERTDNMIITRTSARSLIEFNNGSSIKMVSSACNVRGQYANLVLCDDWLLFNENLMYIERHNGG